MLQQSRMSSKCFWKVSWESKVIPRNFPLVPRHTVKVGFCLSGEFGPGAFDHLGFSGFSLIIYLAHHIAKFRRSCCKSFAAKCTFKLKTHCAVSSANWNSEFCLWCGVRSLT